jgi:hypothetical protein
LVSRNFLFLAGDRKRLGELVDFRRSWFLAGRNVPSIQGAARNASK